MKLTEKQIEFIRAERKTIEAVMRSGGTKGIIRWGAREEAIMLLLQLNNIKD